MRNVSENIAELEAHRPALTGHCYRMLGSAVDAEDAAQETMIRAWRSLDRFDGRASLRTWLYKIATNVCLDELTDRGRRARPMEEGSPSSGSPPLEALIQRPCTHWIEPIADARAIPADADPSERAMLRESIRLAFIAALQTLAPKQRAVLILMEVLGWSAAETAETLQTSVPAVNSALQRARATLANHKDGTPAELSRSQEVLLNRYMTAFEQYDIDNLVALLREDATFSMPPYALWFQGREAVQTWMLGMGSGCRGSRLLATSACGSPAFGQYRPNPAGGHAAWALIVLDLSADQISAVHSFLDTETLFPRFDLPMALAS
ncbi:MAG: sigma-70 family RNA polymerase sigma factor [Bryobacterales bacterium]|nr:sigma-70 family RNA polymerase sigma factor [Bryobacterales bacterium]